MVRIPVIPQLVVRFHEPERARRLFVLAVLLWLVSLAVAGGVVWRLAHRPAAVVEDEAVKPLRAENETLKQQVAVLERADQVGKVAANDLQQSLRERDEEIAALRADLAFYGRLVGGGARREGLAVHSVHVSSVPNSRAWNVTVTLTQNLKRSQIISGHLQMTVEGVTGQQLKSVPWGELASSGETPGLGFSFKYFQQVTGTIMLPEGFTPNRIKVAVDAGSEGGRIDQGFAWAEAQASEESSNVQQQQEDTRTTR
jgi:hypothetical protein